MIFMIATHIFQISLQEFLCRDTQHQFVAAEGAGELSNLENPGIY